MHPSSLAHFPLLYIPCIYNFYNLGKRIDFSPRVSDLRELSAAHPSHSQACRTRARPKKLDSYAPAIVPALYTTPRSPRRPARLLAPLHTPPNPAHLRRPP